MARQSEHVTKIRSAAEAYHMHRGAYLRLCKYVRQAAKAGVPKNEIAEASGLSRMTVWRILNATPSTKQSPVTTTRS